MNTTVFAPATPRRLPYTAPRAELLRPVTSPSVLASLSAEGGLGEYEDDGEL